MARSLLVPYLTGTGPYPEVPPRPMARPMVPWTPYPIRVLDPGPRLDRAEYSEGPSGSAQGSKGQIPDGSQHGTWAPWALWALPRPYPFSLFSPTDLSQANGLQPT